MKVTNTVIELIKNRLRDSKLPKINQSQIAEHMGYGKPWVSKLMRKKIENLTEEQVEKLEAFLGIRFQAFSGTGEKIPEMAMQIGKAMQENESVSRIVSELLALRSSTPLSPKWIETKDMTKIGQEIIHIAFANDDKPGKVARLVLELLS